MNGFTATFRARFPLLTAYWVPLMAGVALVVACLDAEREAYNLPRAHLLSQAIYGAFIVASLGLLWLRPTRTKSKSRGKPLTTQPSLWWGVDVIACTYVFVPLMQHFIIAPRPENSPVQGLYGFPSAHEVSAFALSWLILEAHPRFAPLWFELAVLIGWARLEAHAHFAYQVLSGAALGMGLGWWESHHSNGVLLPRCLALFGRRKSEKAPRKEAEP